MKYGIHTLVIESQFKYMPGFSFEFGWGNGYVLLPKFHPFYGLNYDDISVNAHGGLTFGSIFSSEDFLEWSNGLTIDGDITRDNCFCFDGYYMIGFDTNHYGDNLTKCSKEYVLSEAESLMDQCLDPYLIDLKKYKYDYNLSLRKEKLKNLSNE